MAFTSELTEEFNVGVVGLGENTDLGSHIQQVNLDDFAETESIAPLQCSGKPAVGSPFLGSIQKGRDHNCLAIMLSLRFCSSNTPFLRQPSAVDTLEIVVNFIINVCLY